MRRLRILALVAVAALAVPAAALAAPTTGDFISGSGYRLSGDGEKLVQFRVDARLGGAGAMGTYTFKGASGLTFTGSVTCLEVSGTHASVGGYVTKADPEEDIPVGSAFDVLFADNGSPYRHQAGPDMVSLTEVLAPEDFAGCPDPWGDAEWRTVSGNVTVKDAP
jgi:hypothetical protein